MYITTTLRGRNLLLRLYQTDWCPYCVRVRRKMSELKIEYSKIDVPDSKRDRKELLEISGQYGVPTLVTEEGRVIADDDDAIIDYLVNEYTKS